MNLRPPVPQTGALTRLRYAPIAATVSFPGRIGKNDRTAISRSRLGICPRSTCGNEASTRLFAAVQQHLPQHLPDAGVSSSRREPGHASEWPRPYAAACWRARSLHLSSAAAQFQFRPWPRLRCMDRHGSDQSASGYLALPCPSAPSLAIRDTCGARSWLRGACPASAVRVDGILRGAVEPIRQSCRFDNRPPRQDSCMQSNGCCIRDIE